MVAGVAVVGQGDGDVGSSSVSMLVGVAGGGAGDTSSASVAVVGIDGAVGSGQVPSQSARPRWPPCSSARAARAGPARGCTSRVRAGWSRRFPPSTLAPSTLGGGPGPRFLGWRCDGPSCHTPHDSRNHHKPGVRRRRVDRGRDISVGSAIDRGGRGIRPHAVEGEGKLVLVARTPFSAPVYHAVDAQDVDGFEQHRRKGELPERPVARSAARGSCPACVVNRTKSSRVRSSASASGPASVAWG